MSECYKTKIYSFILKGFYKRVRYLSLLKRGSMKFKTPVGFQLRKKISSLHNGYTVARIICDTATAFS